MDAQRTSEPGPEPGQLLDGWLTRDEVATALGVSPETLQRWQTRRIGPPCVHIGRKVLYRVEAFREWLISRESSLTSSKGARPGGGR